MRIAYALAITVTSAGCFSLDFDFQSTSITATAGDNGVTRVVICAGPGGLLDCNDKVGFDVAVGATHEVAMPLTFGFGALEADFPLSDADTAVAVTRLSDSAAGQVTFPAPFELSGPSATVIPRGTEIRLTWTPSGSDDAMSWIANVTCGESSSHGGTATAIDDTGSVTLSTDDFPQGESGICAASVTLSRTRTGTMSDAFPSGSSIVATQSRTISFQLSE